MVAAVDHCVIAPQNREAGSALIFGPVPTLAIPWLRLFSREEHAEARAQLGAPQGAETFRRLDRRVADRTSSSTTKITSRFECDM
jgi:hypothetical protein